MAQAPVTLALDSGALIMAEKDERVEAVIRKWLREGAQILIPAPAIAESIRGGPKDAAANRIIRAVNNTAETTEVIARKAGSMLGERGSRQTVDALIVATAEVHEATDILTTDSHDISAMVSRATNVIAL